MKKFKEKLQDHYDYGSLVWLRQIVEPIQAPIGKVLCYFGKHNYKDFFSFCSRCEIDNPVIHNTQTRKVLFEKKNTKRRRRVAKR